MKFTFTKQEELEAINNRFADEESEEFECWEEMTKEEILITDAAMFADGAYCKNRFKSIEDFAKRAAKSEGDSVENTIKRLNKMLKKGILVIE